MGSCCKAKEQIKKLRQVVRYAENHLVRRKDGVWQCGDCLEKGDTRESVPHSRGCLLFLE